MSRWRGGGLLGMDTKLANRLFGLLAGVVLIAPVAILGGFLHCRRERLLEHRERMKALELGREIPGEAAAARSQAAVGVPWGEDKGDGGRSPARPGRQPMVG